MGTVRDGRQSGPRHLLGGPGRIGARRQEPRILAVDLWHFCSFAGVSLLVDREGERPPSTAMNMFRLFCWAAECGAASHGF